MRRVVNILGLIAVVMGTTWLCGCGSTDLMDELGQSYQATLTVKDNDTDTVQVDILQDDCDGTPEDYSDALGEIEIVAGSKVAGLTLQSYNISYIPLLSPDRNNVNQMPPDLTAPETGYTTIEIPPASTVTFTITLMSTDTKRVVLLALINDPALVDLSTARYAIRVVMHFRDQYGNSKDITVERTVYLTDYDNC